MIKMLDHNVNKSIEIITFCDAPPGSDSVLHLL